MIERPGQPPWEPQPSEPSKWYHRFHDHYLLSGPERSLELAFRRWCGASEGQQSAAQSQQMAARSGGGRQRPSRRWYQIEREWRWRSRAIAWDEAERLKRLEGRARKLEDLERRHTTLSHGLLNKLILRANQLDPASLSPSETIRWAIELIKLERLLHGEPIDHQKHEHSGPGGAPIAATIAWYQPTEAELEKALAIMDRYAPIAARDEPDPQPEPGAYEPPGA